VAAIPGWRRHQRLDVQGDPDDRASIADTLGLDEDGNPVDIEYKRGRDDKVVVQALS
jgi:RecB family endonuclease NucS